VVKKEGAKKRGFSKGSTPHAILIRKKTANENNLLFFYYRLVTPRTGLLRFWKKIKKLNQHLISTQNRNKSKIPRKKSNPPGNHRHQNSLVFSFQHLKSVNEFSVIKFRFQRYFWWFLVRPKNQLPKKLKKGFSCCTNLVTIQLNVSRSCWPSLCQLQCGECTIAWKSSFAELQSIYDSIKWVSRSLLFKFQKNNYRTVTTI
jgi:hypothetical protein